MKFANRPADRRLPRRDDSISRTVPFWWPALIWLPVVLCCAVVLTRSLMAPIPAPRSHDSAPRWRADAKTFVSVVRYLIEPEQDGPAVYEIVWGKSSEHGPGVSASLSSQNDVYEMSM